MKTVPTCSPLVLQRMRVYGIASDAIRKEIGPNSKNSLLRNTVSKMLDMTTLSTRITSQLDQLDLWCRVILRTVKTLWMLYVEIIKCNNHMNNSNPQKSFRSLKQSHSKTILKKEFMKRRLSIWPGLVRTSEAWAWLLSESLMSASVQRNSLTKMVYTKVTTLFISQSICLSRSATRKKLTKWPKQKTWNKSLKPKLRLTLRWQSWSRWRSGRPISNIKASKELSLKKVNFGKLF